MTLLAILILLTMFVLLLRQYFSEKKEIKLDQEIRDAQAKLNSLLKEESVQILESEITDREVVLKKLKEKIKQVKDEYEIK